MMKGMLLRHKLWEPSSALEWKWVVQMSSGVESKVGEGGVGFSVWGGGGGCCVVLCWESSSRERKNLVGAVGQDVWQQE